MDVKLSLHVVLVPGSETAGKYGVATAMFLTTTDVMPRACSIPEQEQ